jgi:hypothetical protein
MRYDETTLETLRRIEASAEVILGDTAKLLQDARSDLIFEVVELTREADTIRRRVRQLRHDLQCRALPQSKRELHYGLRERGGRFLPDELLDSVLDLISEGLGVLPDPDVT